MTRLRDLRFSPAAPIELDVLEFDLLAARHGHDIRLELLRRRKHISLLDAMVAGHARSQGLILVAGRLSECRKVADLQVECWD
ncbi:hypothetical protein [Cereibacter azotoformans]|uniref:hypothetical protein n=1 Tax=Cereibacter azotoformans TaxID=43057 RepID=UPI000C6EBC5F|nr:hypothetical protein [Cereibacter azotoformans]